MIPRGICLDLETTIAARISNSIRPPGQKRFETRIIEIGACHWNSPSEQFKRLVNPIDTSLKNGMELIQHLHSIHQKPVQTINFWSKVLVNRKSLDRTMFKIEEDPQVWLGRQPQARANDFVRWFNGAYGPKFVSETQALSELIQWSKTSPWLAHNGNSFDFKVIQGCALRCGLRLPERQCYDTLKLFRRHIPGHKSYSQPVLYEKIFNKNYNAHVAIDDAKALSELCRHVSGLEPKRVTVKKKKTSTNSAKSAICKVDALRGPKKQMNLKFDKKYSMNRPVKDTKPKPQKILDLVGVGKKSVAAFSAENIHSIPDLVKKYKLGGDGWLRNVLPYGVSIKRISASISQNM